MRSLLVRGQWPREVNVEATPPSTFAYVNAIILADMVAEKADAIFERAGEFAHERVIDGVHFPTDIEAGRISAAVIDNVLLHNQKFMDDYNCARIEVRRAAGLR